jgi:hypothetical protein
MSEDHATPSAAPGPTPPDEERDRQSPPVSDAIAGDAVSDVNPDAMEPLPPPAEAAPLDPASPNADVASPAQEPVAPPVDPVGKAPPAPRPTVPIEMADATTFGATDVAATVLKTAQETLDQSLVVVGQVWDAIAPILRALAILGLRLLILVGQWGLEQLDAEEPPPARTKAKRSKPKPPPASTSTPAPAIAPDNAQASPPVASPAPIETLEVSQAVDQAIDPGDLDDEELEDLDIEDVDDLDEEQDETLDGISDAQDNAKPTPPTEAPAPKSLGAKLAGVGFSLLKVLWTVGIRIGRILLPKKIGDRLPDPVVGVLASSLVILILWITLSIRTRPAVPAPEPLPLEPVPIESLDLPVTPDEQDTTADDSTGLEDAETTNEEPISEERPHPAEAEPPPEAPIPDAPFIGDLQDQLADVTAQFGPIAIESVQANFLRGRLVITVNDGWNTLESDRDSLATALWERSQTLGFKKLDVVDINGTILARSPVVGSQMVIFDQSAASPPEAVPTTIEEQVDDPLSPAMTDDLDLDANRPEEQAPLPDDSASLDLE